MRPALFLLIFLTTTSCEEKQPEPASYTCGSVFHHCSLSLGCRLCIICTAVDGPCVQTVCTQPDCRETDYCVDIPSSACDMTDGICRMIPLSPACTTDADCGFMEVSRTVPIPSHMEYQYFQCSPQGTCIPSTRYCKPTKCYQNAEPVTCGTDAECDPNWEQCNLYTGYCVPSTCHYSAHQKEEFFTCAIGYHCSPAETPGVLCDHAGCTPGHCVLREPCEHTFDCPDPDMPFCEEGICVPPNP
ncbi:hypothetical protein KKF84_03100 [Myxococcota bacterium]|nr:hypothetical protein [Myxococcota bacterium]MBU1534277.1 hypothetical protein [Myxococcota bacterium]